MQHNEILKYLLDIENLIGEIEALQELIEYNYVKFNQTFYAVRTAERNLEIIGKAVRKLMEINPGLVISGYRDIVGLRNILALSYNAIDPAVLWKIMVKDIPVLKVEIYNIKNK